MSDQPTTGGADPHEATVFGEPGLPDPGATVATPAATGPDPTPPEGIAMPPGGGTPPPGGPGGPGGPDGPYDEEPEAWYRKPAVLAFGGLAIGLLIFLAFVLIANRAGDDDEPDTTTTTSTTTTTTPTTSSTSSSTTSSSTTSTTTSTTTTTTTTTAPPALVPGEPCTPGSSPDCIDPDGDGSYVYLIDGGDCVSVRPDPATCADLDGDGIAGYPDQG